MTELAQPVGLELHVPGWIGPVIARTGYHWAQPGTATVENAFARPRASVFTP
jgi:hypothetical protein